MLSKLKEASTAWRAQFDVAPALPLDWKVDDTGMLLLDGVWICPEKCIRIDEEVVINQVSIDIALDEGFLTVIIVRDFGEYEIVGVERSVRCRK